MTKPAYDKKGASACLQYCVSLCPGIPFNGDNLIYPHM